MSGKATHRGEIHAFRWRYVSITRSCLLIALINILGCEYIRPTLNVPLAQWNPTQGYRFRPPGLPDAGNPERLFIVAAFSGDGMRASALAFGVLQELARQPTLWEGKQMRLKGATLTTQSNVGKLMSANGLNKAPTRIRKVRQSRIFSGFVLREIPST